MKTLVLIRHAKSSWKNPELDDFDRPLNKRGLKAAPFMAQQVKRLQILPDVLISSPANRAWTTASFFADVFEIPKEEMVAVPDIYHAFPDTIESVIKQQSDQWQTLFVFGHNPGFTLFANDFLAVPVDNIPTCGVVILKMAINSWQELDTDKVISSKFIYPKLFSKDL